VVLNQVSDATLRRSRALDGTTVFLKVMGPGSRDIWLQGNDLRKARVPYQLDKDVKADAVEMSENILPR